MTSTNNQPNGSDDIFFRGQFNLNIDDKGRVSIPAKFREVLATRGEDTLVLGYQDQSLVAHPRSQWQRIEAEALSLPQLEPEVRDYIRLIGLAVRCPPDKQGRILIPPAMRGNAALDREVVLNGALDRFEIWSRERWEEKFVYTTTNYASISKAVAQHKQGPSGFGGGSGPAVGGRLGGGGGDAPAGDA